MADKALQSLSLPGLNDTYVNTPLSTAPTFVTTQNYAVGDCVFYNRKLYKFVTAHSARAWDNSHVQEITIADELNNVKDDLSQKYEKPASGIPANDIASGVIPDVSGFYTKPSGGIPSSDLSSGIQTSLGKADTAYQKPSGGIPVSDLASGVIPDVSGKADKVQNATSGNFASLDSNGNLVDSGHKHSDYLTQHQDISGKADKVINATSGNFAGLDSNGNLYDSGSKPSDFLTQHQDISGKADKVQNATSGNFAGVDGNGNLTDSGHKHSDYLTQHQDISGKADKVQNATSGNFASLDANGNLTDSGHKHSDYLTEHQDLTDYVRNTDYASSSVGGVVKVDGDSGTGMHTNGRLRIIPSTSANIKAGTQNYRPIVPYNQHESVFYGLAKAAGDTSQSSSSNAVGTYTDDAKIKIQKMLGIYEAPWELIREDTFTQAASATVQINVDGNGNAFELTDAVLLFEMLPYESESKIQNYFKFYDGSTEVSRSAYVNTTISANSNSYGIFIVIEKKNDLVFVSTKPAVANSNSSSMQLTYREGFTNIGSISENSNYKITKVQMPDTLYGKVHYKLYGKRKWS